MTKQNNPIVWVDGKPYSAHPTDWYAVNGTVYWPYDHPSSVADRALDAELPAHPGWRQYSWSPSATAQRDAVPREHGFQQGPMAGVCWDCGNGGQWLAFVNGNNARERPEWNRRLGAFPGPGEAMDAADAGLATLLADVAGATEGRP